MSKPLLKVLLIDDDEDDAIVVDLKLREHEVAEVKWCSNRQAFVEELKHHYDAILVDFRLRGITGAEAIKLAREIAPDTPIVIVSGSINDLDASAALQLGAADYVLKGSPLERLPNAVLKAVENANLKRENKEQNEREVKNQQAELIGQLSIGLSHDLNGMLGVMMAGTDILRQTADKDESRILAAMESSSRHAAAMIRQLLAFAAGEGGTFKTITAEYLLSKIESMLRGTFPSNIQLEISATPGTAPIYCNELELTKCLLNLSLNSREAMPAGGKLILRAQNSNEPDGLHVLLTVSDNGVGIPENVLPLIFNKFFTTKKSGTGLGLAMAKKIIADHHAKIEVASGPNGTEFSIYLPVRESKESVGTSPAFDGAGKHLLLVEDVEFLRAWMKLVLEQAGYVVHEAANGPDAMSVFLQHSEQIEVLISDIWLPIVMTGPQLAKALRELNKNLKLIFVTGLDATAETDPVPQITIQKPFTREALLIELQKLFLPT